MYLPCPKCSFLRFLESGYICFVSCCVYTRKGHHYNRGQCTVCNRSSITLRSACLLIGWVQEPHCSTEAAAFTWKGAEGELPWSGWILRIKGQNWSKLQRVTQARLQYLIILLLCSIATCEDTVTQNYWPWFSKWISHPTVLWYVQSKCQETRFSITW